MTSGDSQVISKGSPIGHQIVISGHQVVRMRSGVLLVVRTYLVAFINHIVSLLMMMKTMILIAAVFHSWVLGRNKPCNFDHIVSLMLSVSLHVVICSITYH